jgi:hypothetical protein
MQENKASYVDTAVWFLKEHPELGTSGSPQIRPKSSERRSDGL